MAGERVLIIDDSPENLKFLCDYVLEPNGYKTITATDGEQGLNYALNQSPDLVMTDLKMPRLSGLEIMQSLKVKGKDLPVILMTFYGSEETAIQAFRLGAKDYLIKPFTVAEALEAVERALVEIRLRKEKVRLEGGVQQSNQQLAQRVKELNILYSIGKSVAQLLDLEKLLNRVVEGAVYITGAEEGSLLLVDRESGELYLRAARGLGEQFARGFRLKVGDSLAGQVVQTGEPIRIESVAEDQRLKIKTGYLVKSLLNVPLRVGKRIVGVLSVSNRISSRAFTPNDEKLLSALADYAAISIVNAQLFEQLAKSRDEIQRWNRELEKRVQERTEELERVQDQLVRAARLAAVGQLAAGIAHEINNPLGIILGFAQSIAEQVDKDHPLYEPLKIIERETLRGKDIVQHLLDFSRQSEPELKPTHLEQLLEESLVRLQPQISAANVTIERQYEAESPNVLADTERIEQVFTNLIINAVQAMPDGGKLIVGTERVDDQILLIFEDTGVGIASEDLPRIFDPFFTTKEVGEGTGLGLSVSFSIIKQHGGSIEVESEPNQGARFTVKLPLKKALTAQASE
jgi:signal transduction histidine kinase/DNA-binding response OmpR family regulator